MSGLEACSGDGRRPTRVRRTWLRRDLPSRLAGLALLLVLAAAAAAGAQDGESDSDSYKLGPGDILQLNVIQQPELDRTLEVMSDGTAIFPHIGEVAVGGLTLAEAERLVQRRLQLYNNTLVDVSLSVTQYNAMYVYVLGQVLRPGRYTFSSAPDVWDVIRTAGGTNAEADPSRIRVITQQGGLTSSTVLDLSPLLEGREAPPDLMLKPGDTIIVPGQGQAAGAREDGAQVFGAVAAPGVYPLHAPMRLVSVLMMAGAPLEGSDLDEIYIVHPDPETAELASRRVDLNDFIKRANESANPLVYPGDTVRVGYREPGFFRSNYPIILGTLTTAATLYLIYHRVND